MISDKQLKIVLECAQEYKKNLLNKNLIFIYKHPKTKEYYYIESLFLDENFLHLTGLIIDRDKIINAETFYNLAIQNNINKEHVSLRTNGTTEMKLSVLHKIVDISNNAKMIGNYSNTKTLLYTEKLVGNIYACLGLRKFNNSKYYYPDTALKEDIRNITEKPQGQIIAILEKNKEDLEYNKLDYINDNVSLKDVITDINIVTKISDDVYKQEPLLYEQNYINKLKVELSTIANKEYKKFCKELDCSLKSSNSSPLSKEELEANKKIRENKFVEIRQIYSTAVEKETSLYHGINADNVIYFDKRDEIIFNEVKEYYLNQPQSKIDKILENINSLPKGLNPEGKLDILRNNGIKHSSEMEPEERKAAFEKEEVITPKFGGKDI